MTHAAELARASYLQSGPARTRLARAGRVIARLCHRPKHTVVQLALHHWAILLLLLAGRQTICDLSLELEYPQSTTSDAVDLLVAKRLVKRHHDPENHSRHYVALTPKAVRLLVPITPGT